jgi:hypothetical protein
VTLSPPSMARFISFCGSFSSAFFCLEFPVYEHNIPLYFRHAIVEPMGDRLQDGPEKESFHLCRDKSLCGGADGSSTFVKTVPNKWDVNKITGRARIAAVSLYITFYLHGWGGSAVGPFVYCY